MKASHLRSLFPCSFLLCLTTATFSQDLVSTEAGLRSALLEEFTAIHCGNCPAGHALAAAIEAAHPGQVVQVELAGGSLSVPNAGEPDLRTSWSLELWSHYAVATQPRALIGRSPYSGLTVISTGNWSNAVDALLQLSSPVNIGVASHYDAGTQTLNVDVEAYYTADSPGAADRLCVLIKENHIIGYQQDYMNGAHSDYDHVNVLRAYITPLWGDEVENTIAGSLVQRSYAFDIPEEWDIANCEVVAFIGEYQGEVYQAREVDAQDGSTGVNAPITALPALRAFPVPATTTVFFPTDATTTTGLTVMDQSGRVVIRTTIMPRSGLFALDVTQLSTGVYTCVTDGVRTRFIVSR